MPLPLYTHILRRVLLMPVRLSGETQALIQSSANEIMFNAARIWKIAIKARLGRDDFTARPEAVVRNARDVGFVEAPIHADAATRWADSPLHYRDPFDRVLIAQALNAPARLLTLDLVLCRYSDLVMLVNWPPLAAQPR